jgi:hypothetical protein
MERAYNYEIGLPTALLIVPLALLAVTRRKCASNLFMLKNCLSAAGYMMYPATTLALNLPHIFGCECSYCCRCEHGKIGSAPRIRARLASTLPIITTFRGGVKRPGLSPKQETEAAGRHALYWLSDAVPDKEFLLVFAANSLALAFRRAGRPALSWSHCAR